MPQILAQREIGDWPLRYMLLWQEKRIRYVGLATGGPPVATGYFGRIVQINRLA